MLIPLGAVAFHSLGRHPLVGLAAAFAGTRLLTSLLFHVRPTDPEVYVAVAVLLAAVMLVASYIPASRAARIDPLTAIRQE